MLKASALGFERESHTLFSNLTFEVEPGSLLFIRGPNGSGKSSLLKILAGIWRPTTGTVSWGGEIFYAKNPAFLADLLYIGDKIGITPALTPLQNLQWLLSLKNINAVSPSSLVKTLQAVGLSEFLDIPCEQLSKGQCQRVVLARLWCNPPKCWILDEPLTGLDVAGQKLFSEQCLLHLEQQGMIIMSSHQPLDFRSLKQHELVLKDNPC